MTAARASHTQDPGPAAATRNKAVLNRVIVNPHAGRKGAPNLTPELKLQFLRDRTEFDWRF